MKSIKIACALLLVGGASSAFASLMSLGPTSLGDIGSLPTVLTIENSGTASGCVGFIAGSDVTGLAACPGGFTGIGGNEIGGPTQTGTRTIAELNAAGITSASNLMLVLNSGEPMGQATIQDLALTFFNPTSGSTFTATLPGTPMTFAGTPIGMGIAFGLDATQAGFASDFFSNSANRIGAAATLLDTTGGTETFLLAPASAGSGEVPEPAPLLTVGSGLLLMFFFLPLIRRHLDGV